MEFLFKINEKQFSDILNKASDKIFNNLVKGSKKQANLYNRYIVKEYLSGRRADDTGLRRQSKMYAQSWDKKVEFNKEYGISAYMFSNVEYGKYHENTHGEYAMKKRTFILEDFKSIGLVNFMTEWYKSFSEKV